MGTHSHTPSLCWTKHTVFPPTVPPPTMAMSGVQLAEGCMEVYNDIQKNKKYLYATFLIADGKIQVEVKGEKGGSLEEQYARFLKDLQKKDGAKDDCRFAVYDYEYLFAPEGAEAQAKSKLILLNWCPDTAAIKKKMLYSSSFGTLKRAFVGVHKVKQANDESDIQQTDIEAFLRETDRN